MRFFLLFYLISTSQLTVAYGKDYQCKIDKVVLSGSKAGMLDVYQKLYLGKEFTVDKQSGKMIGALKNSYLTKPQVIDYGSTGNSYKVVTTMRENQGVGAGSNIYALNVMEFSSSKEKPFVFLSNSEVYFGVCKHF